MAFIYNLSDTWNDAATTWNGIKLAVTNTSSDASSKLLNLTVTGATTASFVVDKSGNLVLNGSVNKITMTAPATGATLTLADNSTFVTSGAYSSTFTFSGTTTLTFPTSGTVTALGNTTTGSGAIVLASSPTLITPALGTPSSGVLSGCTGYPVSALTGTGTGVLTALAVNVGSAGSFVTFNGALGTPSSGNLSNCTGYLPSNLSGINANVATWLGTPSSANLAAAVTDETGSGSLVFATSPTLVSPALGTPTSVNLTYGTNLPISTGVDGLGTGVATFLATPSSANLASAVTDETGSGSLVFATDPVFPNDITLGVASSAQGELILANTSANTVKLRSSNYTAANYTLTFPEAAPVNGYYLQTDTNGVLSWAAGGGGGGGGSPGGSNTQVQFNNAGAFGGDAAFTFVNGTGTATLTLGVASTTSAALKIYNSSSANSVTIASGNNTASWTLTLPPDDGSANQFLQTDGSGNTIWAAAAAGTINTGTVGQITYYSGTNTLSGTTTGTGVLTALGNNTNSAGGFPVLNGSGFLAVAQGGTATGTAGIGAFNNITGYTASGATGTTSTNLVFSTSPTITTPTISGNETHTGTAARFIADFDNATVNSRFGFQTSTTNASTGIYALPNGTSTASSWQAANAADPTNASKILIATNGSTDVQLVSGINGTGPYLPLSIYTSGGQSAQFSTTKGTLSLGVASTTAGVLTLYGGTSGSVTLGVPLVAGSTTFTLPGSNGTSGYALTTNGSGVTSWSVLGVAGGGTGSSAFTANYIPYSNGTILTSSANLTFNGTTLTTANDVSINSLTVGKGAGAVASNIAFGSGALASNTTGALNVAVGYQALYNNTTGVQNVAIGPSALILNTTGLNNMAIGYTSLYYTNGGSGNTAIGTQSLLYNVTGSNNVAIGYNSLAGVSTNSVSNNTAIGYSALQATTASNLTAIGYQALYSNTTGATNTAIGYNSGYGITTGSNNVIIGSYQGSAAPISATGSNYIVLSDGAANVRAYWDSNGNLKSNATIAGAYNNPAAGTTAMAFGSYKVVKVTPNATATFTTTVPASGATGTLIIVTSGTPSYTITFGTGFLSTGTLATGTVTAKTFCISFVSDGTTMIETARTVAM